jgi:hypothetical protein
MKLSPTAIEIVKAYLSIAERHCDWTRLARIRPKVKATREQFDKACWELTKTDLVHLAPESNRKVLLPEDHDAAIRRGSEDMHLFVIEDEFIDLFTAAHPAPAAAAPKPRAKKPGLTDEQTARLVKVYADAKAAGATIKTRRLSDGSVLITERGKDGTATLTMDRNGEYV